MSYLRTKKALRMADLTWAALSMANASNSRKEAMQQLLFQRPQSEAQGALEEMRQLKDLMAPVERSPASIVGDNGATERAQAEIQNTRCECNKRRK
eukprot:IDg20382t1